MSSHHPAPASIAHSPARVTATPRTDGTEQEEHSKAERRALFKTVTDIKTILERPLASTVSLVSALKNLEALGSLPTGVLAASLIGRTVHRLAKGSSAHEAVRRQAHILVESWKQVRRRREGKGAGAPCKDAASASSQCARKKSSSSTAQGEGNGVDIARKRKCSAGGSGEGARAEQHASRPRRASAMDVRRASVEQKILEALTSRRAEETNLPVEKVLSLNVLAALIEGELFEQLDMQLYLSQARSIIYNLKDAKNKTFALRLLTGELDLQSLARFTSEEMASEVKITERAKIRQASLEEALRYDKEDEAAGDGMFPCGRCHSSKTRCHQSMGGSLDKPIATLVKCLSCGFRWKFQDVGASDACDGC